MNEFKDLITFEYDEKTQMLEAKLVLKMEQILPPNLIKEQKDVLKDAIATHMLDKMREIYLDTENMRCPYSRCVDGTEDPIGLGVFSTKVAGEKYFVHPTRDVSDGWLICSFRTMQQLHEALYSRCSYRLFESTNSLPYLNKKVEKE